MSGHTVPAFVESEAILSAQEGDWDELYRLIGLMLPGERERLAYAAEDLRHALGTYPFRWSQHGIGEVP